MANSRMKLMSLIASGRMDVVISDMKTFEYLAGQGLFMPLLVSKDETGGFVVEDGRIYAGRLLADDVNKVLDQAAGKSVGPSSGMTSANIAKQPDYAVLATDNYGETWIYGVKLEGTRFLNFSNITGRDLVISVYSSPFNRNLAFKMVDMILNLDPSELEGDEDNDDY